MPSLFFSFTLTPSLIFLFFEGNQTEMIDKEKQELMEQLAQMQRQIEEMKSAKPSPTGIG